MDILIIGKAEFQRLAPPVVVYCGQSREEAAAAVEATAGKLPYLYQVNAEPAIPVAAPEAPKLNLTAKPQIQQVSAAPEPAEEPKLEAPAPAKTKKKQNL
jgi:hypothetical protein